MSQAEKPLEGLFSSKVKLGKHSPIFLLETFLGETRSSPDGPFLEVPKAGRAHTGTEGAWRGRINL